MRKINWEYLGYNRDGTGYRCKKCNEVFSNYATIGTDGRCPKCGCKYSEEITDLDGDFNKIYK